MRNVLQFTQEEWLRKSCTDHYSRGAWEFGGRTYPEEWIGRRNTIELETHSLIAEGVSFEIIGEHEWSEKHLKVPVGDVAYEEGDVVSVYLETWFDADKKFGTYTHDEPDTWINLYALLNLTQNRLTMKYFICRQDSEDEFAYIPTTKERELVIRLIREAMERDGI